MAKIKQDVLLPIMSLETLAEPTRVAAKLMKNAKSVTMIDMPGLNGNNWQTSPEKILDAIKPWLDKA